MDSSYGSISETSLHEPLALVASDLGISPSIATDIYTQYLARRKEDSYSRTQDIFYQIVGDIRKTDATFPHTLQKLYVVTTAFSKQGLTPKKSPNAYVSQSTGKRKMTPSEVVDIISLRQHMLLSYVRSSGLALGYAQFAHTTNTELDTAGDTRELPLDWKWLSKKLGNGEGKNLHTGGGFMALKLSEDVRYEMTRILQGLPIYPKKSKIRNNKTFKKYLSSYLEEWQWNEEKGGFHEALMSCIVLWNADEKYGKKYFSLPIVLFPTDKQESLGQLLRLRQYSAKDFLEGLGIPEETWQHGYDANRESIKSKGLLLRRLREELYSEIRDDDFILKKGIVKWSPRALERYVGQFDLSRAQEIYDVEIFPMGKIVKL